MYIHWSLAVLSYLIVSWLWWFSSSFMKFWYFWISLNKHNQSVTSHTIGCESSFATRTPARSSVWSLTAQFPACFLTAATGYESCSVVCSSTSKIRLSPLLRFASAPYEPPDSPTAWLGSTLSFSNSSTQLSLCVSAQVICQYFPRTTLPHSGVF